MKNKRIKMMNVSATKPGEPLARGAWASMPKKKRNSWMRRKKIMRKRAKEILKRSGPSRKRWGNTGSFGKDRCLRKVDRGKPWNGHGQIFIILLIIALETIPIFVKLLAGKGPYDELLERHEEELLIYKNEMLLKSRESSRGRSKIFMAVNGQRVNLSLENQLHLERLKAAYERSIEEAKLSHWKKNALSEWEV